jgi:hypothetical protein
LQDVEVVKDKMQDNISRIIANQDNLENLQDKTGTIALCRQLT